MVTCDIRQRPARDDRPGALRLARAADHFGQSFRSTVSSGAATPGQSGAFMIAAATPRSRAPVDGLIAPSKQTPLRPFALLNPTLSHCVYFRAES